MSAVPAQGFVPHRQRHRHHHRNERRYQEEARVQEEPEEKRPKVNPIFLWASQHDQKIVEVRCEDYDKRNRIKLTKTAQGWRSIPRTASNTYPVLLNSGELVEMESKDTSEKENGLKEDEQLRRLANGDLEEFVIKERVNSVWITSDGENERRKEDEVRKSEGIRKTEEIKKSDELRNRNAIRKRNEIRKSDEMRKWKEEREEKRKGDELRERVEKRKQDELIERDKIRNRDENRKRKKDHEVLGYAPLGDGVNGWKLGKRRNNHRRQKRKRVMSETEEVERNDYPVEEEEKATSGVEEERSRKKQKCIDFDAMGRNRLMQPRVMLEQLQLRETEEGRGSRKDEGRGGLDTKIPEENVETFNYIEGDEGDEEEGEVDGEDGERGEENASEEIEELIEVGIEEEREEKSAVQKDENTLEEKELEEEEREPQHEEDERDKGEYDEGKQQNDNSNHIESMDQSSEEDFQDILKMLDSSSFSSSKLLSSFKSVKLLEELELSLTGIEDDVVEKTSDRLDLQTPTGEQTTGKESLESSTSYFVMENDIVNNNIVSNDNISKNNFLNNNNDEVHRLVQQSNQQLEKCLEEVEINLKRAENEVELITTVKDNNSGHLEELENLETDSSRILKALRNTPGLSVSIATKPLSSKITKLAKKPSSGGSRSPDSQMELREMKTTQSSLADANRFSGLSIAIPTWQNRTKPDLVPIKPSLPKSRIESPESTVSFPRLERQLQAPDPMNDEDDCDAQVMEDIRRQNKDYHLLSEQLKQFQEELEAPMRKMERNSNPVLQMVSNRSNEAQAKRGGEDSGFRIQELMDDSKSQGSSAVSPQPSGIPCSPTSRRSSSAYLERLLPSPPCSVSCSEDAKNDLTLKGILSTPSCLESKDQMEVLAAFRDRQRQESNPEGWRAPSREVNHIMPELRISELQMSDIQRVYQCDGRSLFNEAHNAFLLAQQQAQYMRSRQMRGSKLPSNGDHRDHRETFVDATSTIPDMPLSPASQLRELIKTLGHLIPDPLLVPRHCLPGLAAAPSIEIPKLLTSRPELRLPEALHKPELLRDPDLLVISIAHLQYVLDQGQDPFAKSRQNQVYNVGGSMNNISNLNESSKSRPKLSCKPIGTLMPAPIDLSRSRKNSFYPPLLRVRSGLLKQESEVSSTASNLEEHHLWHPLFNRRNHSSSKIIMPLGTRPHSRPDRCDFDPDLLTPTLHVTSTT